MQPLLTVDHGTTDEIASGVDAFARFYVAEFHKDILAASIKKRRTTYLVIATIIFVLMATGIVPMFINSTSMFAYILMILSAIMLGGIIFCLLKVKNAPAFCEKNIGAFFGSQLSVAKSADRAVRQTRFCDEHIEVFTGDPAKKAQQKKRLYQDIQRVFETDDIYYFQGVGWVPKERLSPDDDHTLRSIISANFKGDRFVFREALLS